MNVTMGRGPGLDSAFVAGVSPDNASGSSGKSTSEQQADSGHPDSPDDDGLGPLPPNWEKAFTEKGEPYFIDHNSGINQSQSNSQNGPGEIYGKHDILGIMG